MMIIHDVKALPRLVGAALGERGSAVVEVVSD
jgi:hypothetical protein